MAPIYLFSFLLAFALTWYLTPRMANAAMKMGIVDVPDKNLKTHDKTTPYLGGLAIYIPFILTLGITFSFNHIELFALLLSSTIIITLGLIDDIGALSPGIKILGQAIAVFVLIKGGVYIQLIFLPQWISILLTFLWLIGITNAVNIIDIKDGLAGGVVFIISVYLFILSVINGDELIGIFTITFAGSILGFMRFNWNPASIYLGDAGSMFLGFLIGALAMSVRYTQHNDVSALAPFLLLGVPIFDTLLVTIVRLRKGISPFRGSSDHFAHRLLISGWKINHILITVYIATSLLGGVVLYVRALNNIWLATGLVSFIFVIGIILLFIFARIRMK
jgi:UDP-GlcNAc:undecaprenyl-phosphate GlcNAc-1-phosphate transferase